MKLALFPMLAAAILGGFQVESHSQHPHGHFKPPNRNNMKTTIPKLDLSNMDNSTSPLDNFYQFVNGGWLKKNSIPSDMVDWGCHSEIEQRVETVLKKITLKASKSPGNLIGDMYNLGMNETAIEKSGLTDISDLFQEISNIKNKKNILGFIGRLHSEGFNPFFSLNPSRDSKNNSHVLAHMNEGGLGLMDRGYYFDRDKAEVRKTYKKHIQKVFALAKETHPKQGSNDAYNIELFLANVSTPVDDTDPNKKYNKYTYARLKSLTNITWDHYFKNLGLTPKRFGDIIIDNPRFFKTLPKVFTKFKLPQIKNYLKWYILDSTSFYLSKPFQKESFQFFGHFLAGQQKPSPRWKKIMYTVTSDFKDLVDKTYINEAFPPKAKEQALTMVKYIQNALIKRIQKLNWIEKSTKNKALKKVKNMNFRIGHPNHWDDDYSDIKLDIGRSFLYNYRKVVRRAKKKAMRRINKRAKRSKWEMATFEVNAYYNPQLNEVVFPAAILQPIFFFSSNKGFSVDDMAFNFGGIGACIGHELTHGFDSDGRKYDSKGALVNWWTETDSKKFEKRAKTIIEQFNNVTFHNKKVNGVLTQGENIADLGGLKISYDAFQNWKKKQRRQPNNLHGFSPNQQFFIAYAQTFRALVTKEEALDRLQNDPHAPDIHRVNQPLSNMQEFYDAFGQPRPNQGMYRKKEDRVDIW